MIGIESIVFDINEAFEANGLPFHTTQAKLIFATIATPVLTYILFFHTSFGEKLMHDSMDKANQRSTLILLYILYLYMVVATGGYILLAISLLIALYVYVVFTNDKYRYQRYIIESIINKIL